MGSVTTTQCKLLITSSVDLQASDCIVSSFRSVSIASRLAGQHDTRKMSNTKGGNETLAHMQTHEGGAAWSSTKGVSGQRLNAS